MPQKELKTVNQRMRRLGMSICDMCMELGNRGVFVTYGDVAAVFRGEAPKDADISAKILVVLDEKEGKRHG